MANPFEFIKEIREMNISLTERLDAIIERLDILIEMEQEDMYGDGK